MLGCYPNEQCIALRVLVDAMIRLRCMYADLLDAPADQHMSQQDATYY